MSEFDAQHTEDSDNNPIVPIEDTPEEAVNLPDEVMRSEAQNALAEFENMTLYEALAQFFYAPRATLEALWWVAKPAPRFDSVLQSPTDSTTDSPDAPPRFQRAVFPVSRFATSADPQQDEELAVAEVGFVGADTVDDSTPLDRWQLGLYGVGFLLAVLAGVFFISDDPRRTESANLVVGAPFALMGMTLWGVALSRERWQQITTWWQTRSDSTRYWLFAQSFPVVLALWGVWVLMDASDDVIADNPNVFEKLSQGVAWVLIGTVVWGGLWGIRAFRARMSATKAFSNDELPPVAARWWWLIDPHPLRVGLAGMGTLLTFITWLGTSNNFISTETFYLWMASVVCWVGAIAPRRWWQVRHNLRDAVARVRGVRWREYRHLLVALALIFVIGLNFRVVNLFGEARDGTAIPQEMTSDHVEKILDAQRVKDGSRNIFFANNGGREPFQMYALALLSYTGVGINHTSLKLLAVIESLITLPVFFWLGREIVGERYKRFGLLLGVVLMALLAISYWHVTITRLALRIVLTPLISALLLIFLVRGIRYNRTGDFILAGLILGFGLYMYQAVRMLPVVVLAGVGLGILFVAKTWFERVRYVANLGALVLVSFIIFVPLFHYSLENPQHFWMRTAGRLLGDDLITETLSDGRVIEREATLEERLGAFRQNMPVLLSNIRNAVLMFNWKGDVAWINGYPNYPALDIFSGALLLVGAVVWGAWLLIRRDAGDALVPVMLVIMLFPSALSIAYPIENPSLTRTSGAIPSVMLLAGVPMAWLLERLLTYRHQWVGRIGAGVLCVGVIFGGYVQSSTVYFTKFPVAYSFPSLPYSDAGRVLREFALYQAGYGNAFMVAYPYWWDHRAVGLSAGVEGVWQNGVYDFIPNDTLTRSVDYVPHFMREAFNRRDRTGYDPERPLLFFYSPFDEDTSQQLRAWFPEGEETLMPSYQETDSFKVYRAMPLGLQGYIDFITLTNPQ